MENEGNKYKRIIDQILANREINEDELEQYRNKMIKLDKKLGFVSYFLVMELPENDIDKFDRIKWQSITKITKFKKLSYEAKKGCLMLCGVYGIFEQDLNATERTNRLQDALKEIEPEDLILYSNLKMDFDPEFLTFFEENKNHLGKEEIISIQNNWNKIKAYVEVKSLDNIKKYLEIINTKDDSDSFEVYMKANNIPKEMQQKYRIIYEQMAARVKTSIPTCLGKNENGYSYEILNFNDPRILRFGNEELIKCCQKQGSNGEGSMIYSAIESTARVIMIRDESGKYIAGSLITHQIDKDGKSYVCFDSIEVNAKSAHIKTDDYQVTLRKIEKLKKRGLLVKGDMEEFYNYYNNNRSPTHRPIENTTIYRLLAKLARNNRYIRKIKNRIDITGPIHITSKDLKALETNKKIQDVYMQVCEDMIKADEKKRKQQLENGEITEKEYEHLLMKNGIFTVGRNPISMYLGNLDKLDKKSMEKLPVPQKDRSIYKKAHKKNFLNFLSNASLMSLNATSFLIIAYIILTRDFSLPILGMGTIYASASAFGNWLLNRKKIKGVYTDAKYEQYILMDARNTKEQGTEQKLSFKERKKLQEKLLYNEHPALSDPIEFDKLSPDTQEKLRRLSEVSFNDKKENYNFENKYVVGNLENWGAIFRRENELLILEDILLANPFNSVRNYKKSTEAQKDLLKCLSQLSDKYNVEYQCENPRINRYLKRVIKRHKHIQPRKILDKDFLL